MRIDEYARLDAVGLAALIRSGACSQAEVRAVAAQALALAHQRLNCMVEIRDPAGADVDPARPLAGVPFVYKDAGAHEAGVLQELGSRLAAGLRTHGETYVAERFRGAGRVNLGRTTTAELTYNSSAETSAYGATANPWNLAHSAGGSSGGSAAVVAAGAVPIAHATDGGGSIRGPAAWCGLVGLKPSRGRVSAGPDSGEALFGLATEHVLTRSVRDCAAVLDAVHGYRSGDPFRIAEPDRPFAQEVTAPLERLRIGLVAPNWAGGRATDPQCLAAAERTAALLQAAGHTVEPATIAIDAEAFLLATTQIWCSGLALWVHALAGATGRKPADHLDPAILTCFEHGCTVSGTDIHLAFITFNAVARAVGALFDRFDVLITPTTAETAPLIGDLDPCRHSGSALDWTRHQFGPAPMTSTFNTTGHPAISLPLAEHANGLPIGVQFVAHHGAEARLFRLGGFLEQAMPWAGRTAPLHVARTEAEALA